MEKFFHTKGIVLKKRNWREDDRLFSIFTAELGRIEAVAVGARKARSKLAGALAAPGILELVFVAGRAVKKITHAFLIRDFPLESGADYFFWNGFAELLDKFSHEEKEAELWRLAVRFIERMSQEKNYGGKKLFLNLFIIKMLAILGYDILKSKPSSKLSEILVKLGRVAASTSVRITKTENDYLFESLKKYLSVMAERPIKSLDFVR